MSARVSNPINMSELGHLRNSGAIDRAATPSLNLERVARVSRDLFGPVNHDETIRFVEQELMRQAKRDSEKWGFDFILGEPDYGNNKYAWSKVAMQTEAHLIRPIKRPEPRICSPASNDDSSNEGEESITDMLNRKEARDRITEETKENSENITQRPMKNQQLLMTDFLKSRKRPHSTTTLKKVSLLGGTSQIGAGAFKVTRRS